MNEHTELYWYNYCFREGDAIKTTYMGYEVKDKITKKLIQEAKEYANCFACDNTALISISYLGYMSTKYFTEQI